MADGIYCNDSRQFRFSDIDNIILQLLLFVMIAAMMLDAKTHSIMC